MIDGKPSFPFSASVTAAVAAFLVSGAQAPGRIWGYQVMNNTAALAYLQVFDKAVADVTLGTTVPDWVIPLAANSLILVPPIAQPIARHQTAITVAGTTTRGGLTTAAIDVLLWVSN